MAKTRKPGSGRKKLPDADRKINLSFRAEPALAAALKVLADENARTVSGELLFQVRKLMRDAGRYKT